MSPSSFDPSPPRPPGPDAGSPQPPDPSFTPAHEQPSAFGVGPAPEAQLRPEESPRRRRGLVAGVVASVLVIVGGAGAVAAYQVLAPKGAQPDTVIPASALAFVRLDLDPSAGQKISATRFLSRLPKVAKDGDAVDLKQTLWDSAVRAQPDLQALDYATDVEPWLGDRAGLALLPGGTLKEPNIVVALEATDPAKAKAGIEKVATASGSSADDLEVTTKGDYAYITRRGNGAAVLSELAKGSLSTSATYTNDLAALGDSGVASAWVDTAGIARLLPSLVGSPASTTSAAPLGRVAMALRFDADHVELAGVTRGGQTRPVTAPSTGGAATLPADTMVALQVSGLGDGLQQAWPQLEKSIPGGTDQLKKLQDQLGVTLPGDLVTLLGSSTTVSMPKQDLSSLDSELPAVGAKITTTDAGGADALVTRLSTSLGADGVVKHEVAGD